MVPDHDDADAAAACRRHQPADGVPQIANEPPVTHSFSAELLPGSEVSRFAERCPVLEEGSPRERSARQFSLFLACERSSDGGWGPEVFFHADPELVTRTACAQGMP